MTRFCLIGPTYPYRGGIAHYTTLLAQQLRQAHEVLLISFSRQYPGWLFPGRSDKDPSQRPLQTEAEYILDPLNPFSWWRVLHRLREWQPEVVVIPWWHPYFALAWAALGRGIKRLSPPPELLFICHNVLPHEQGRLSKPFLPPLLKLALRNGDGFIVHSQADGTLLQTYLPEASTHVTPHPTYALLGEGDSASVVLPVTLPDDRPLLLFCGLVRPYKGVDILLEAFALALQQRRYHLLIAGEFWQGGTTLYRQQITRLDLHDHVTLLDAYLPNELLVALIDRADVVVLPYRSATQSGIIQIAFGRGKPVITTDVGGLAEVVADGRTGLVVPAADPVALAGAIDRFFNADLGCTLAQNIKQDNGRFDWQHLIHYLLPSQKR